MAESPSERHGLLALTCPQTWQSGHQTHLSHFGEAIKPITKA